MRSNQRFTTSRFRSVSDVWPNGATDIPTAVRATAISSRWMCLCIGTSDVGHDRPSGQQTADRDSVIPLKPEAHSNSDLIHTHVTAHQQSLQRAASEDLAVPIS